MTEDVICHSEKMINLSRFINPGDDKTNIITKIIDRLSEKLDAEKQDFYLAPRLFIEGNSEIALASLGNNLLSQFGCFSAVKKETNRKFRLSFINKIQETCFEFGLPYPENDGDIRHSWNILEEIGPYIVQARNMDKDFIIHIPGRTVHGDFTGIEENINVKGAASLEERLRDDKNIAGSLGCYIADCLGGYKIAVLEAKIGDLEEFRFSPLYDNTDKTIETLWEAMSNPLPASRVAGDFILFLLFDKIQIPKKKICMMSYGRDMVYWCGRDNKHLLTLVVRIDDDFDINKPDCRINVHAGIDQMKTPLHDKSSKIWEKNSDIILSRLENSFSAILEPKKTCEAHEVMKPLEEFIKKIGRMIAKDKNI